MCLEKTSSIGLPHVLQKVCGSHGSAFEPLNCALEQRSEALSGVALTPMPRVGLTPGADDLRFG